MSFHLCEAARLSLCYNGLHLGHGQSWGAHLLQVGSAGPAGILHPPSQRQPRPDPTRSRERARTYPLHIPAPRGAQASVPAAAISLRRVPAAADSAPGRLACPAGCQPCPPPVCPCGPGSRPGPQPSPDPALRGSRGREGGPRTRAWPRPSAGRRRARARQPNPTAVGLGTVPRVECGEEPYPHHPAASAAFRRSRLLPLQSPAPAPYSTQPGPPRSRACKGSWAFSSQILNSEPADTFPPPHLALWPSLLPWAPCSVPVPVQHPA